MSTILIKNGKIWDGEKFYFADVLTAHERISKIEPAIDTPADFIFDANGKIVSPGLIDCHVHIKGISPGSFGIDPQMGSFPFGVTAINDAGSIPNCESKKCNPGCRLRREYSHRFFQIAKFSNGRFFTRYHKYGYYSFQCL